MWTTRLCQVNGIIPQLFVDPLSGEGPTDAYWTRATLQEFVSDHVEPDAQKFTDEATAYEGLANHKVCLQASHIMSETS